MRVLSTTAGVFAAAPATMWAGVLTEKPADMKIHLDKVKAVHVPVPSISPTEVLVEVAASSVNPVDWKLIETAYAQNWTYPHVFGRDFAGVVVKVGDQVSHLKVGDQVWGDSFALEGGMAQYLAVDASITGVAPSSITLPEAAALPLVGLTALQGFTFGGGPWESGRMGTVVLVLGGSGGAGHVAVQLAKAWGATEVITTCGTTNVDFCKGLGATRVIDYHKQDWHTVVPMQSVDFVYDTVALAGTGDKVYNVLRENGRFATLLPSGLASNTTAARRPDVKQEFYLLSETGFDRLDVLSKLVDESKMKPHVDSTFALHELADAFNHSIAGHTVGKISVVAKQESVLV